MKKKIYGLVLFLSILLIPIVTVFCLNLDGSGIEEKKKISFLKNDDIEIAYKDSVNINGGTLLIYNDSLKDEYIFKDNKLVGYFKNITINEQTTKESKEEIKKISKDEKIKELTRQSSVDISEIIKLEKEYFKDYTLTRSSYLDSYDEFGFTYTRIIDGYFTNDFINITYDVKGNMSSFVSSRQGILSAFQDYKVDRKALELFVNDYMNKEYKGMKFEIEHQIIDLVEEKLVMVNYIVLHHEDGSLSTTLVNFNL